MATSKHIELICVVILLCTLLVTVLFMNGEALGLTPLTDADETDDQFTANDRNADWDRANATQITLTGDGGSVSGNGAYIYDGDVHIVYAGCYVLSGELTDGSVIVDADGDDKIWILLDGVSLHCEDSAAIVVEQADKVFLTLAEGTENTVSSGASYTEDAVSSKIDGAIYSRDDLTINGSGTLTVNAEYKHGIVGNDDLVIVGAKIEITAAQDGIHANDSARFADVDITINAGDDGITVSNDDETAYLYVASGNFSIPSCYEGMEAIDITIAGGVIDIRPMDDGINANGRGDKSMIRIRGGDITIINENGRDADGLDSNGSIEISGGNIFISVNGNGGSCALDYGSENGGVCTISGGTVIAAGGSTMAEGFDSSSEQGFVMLTTSAEAGTDVTLKNSTGTVLLSETIPCNFSSVVLSTPELQIGETCTVTIGDTETEITVDNASPTNGLGMGGMFGGGKGDMFGGGMQQGGDFGEDFSGGFGGRGGRTEQSNDGWASEERLPMDGIPPEGLPEMPDEGFGRGQMPQMPDGFAGGEVPDGQTDWGGRGFPRGDFDPDGMQEDFSGEAQVPNQGRGQGGMDDGNRRGREQFIQIEHNQQASDEATAASPDVLISVGICVLLLLAGILAAIKVKH